MSLSCVTAVMPAQAFIHGQAAFLFQSLHIAALAVKGMQPLLEDWGVCEGELVLQISTFCR